MNPMVAGGIVNSVGALVDDLFTSDEERLRADLDAMRIGLEAARVDADLIKGQQTINAAEAAHPSVFVAGWRPAIGWVGVAALLYQFLAYPLLTWVWALLQAAQWVPAELTPPPILDIEALLVLLTGILGIAGARTFEKVRGVSGTKVGSTARSLE